MHDYMKEQMERMIKHKHKLDKKENKDVPLDDAAMHYVQTGLADKYSKSYFKNHRITCEETDVKELKNQDRCLHITLEMRLEGCDEYHKKVTVDRTEIKYCMTPNGCEYIKRGKDGLNYCRKEE